MPIEIKILKCMLFVIIVSISILFFYYLRKERIVSNRLKEAYTALDEAAVKRERKTKRNVLIRKKGTVSKKGFRKYIEGAEKLYIYSGLGRMFSGLTFEIWTVIVLVAGAGIYFIVLTITGSLYRTFLFVAVYVVMIIGIEKLLALYSYKRVDENMINFLNILENYNATDSDIISIFSKVSRYLPDPLRTVLEECCYEAQLTGDKRIALYALAEKIENASFKNFIYDIEISVNYSANFMEIINKSRKIIKEEQTLRRDRRSLASELSFTMLMMSALIIGATFIANGLLTTGSIWDVALHTVVGKVCLAVIIGIYIFFYYKLATLGR